MIIEKVKQAIKHLNTAKNLLRVTYPLAKEPKILIGAMTNIEQAHQNLFEAIIPKLDTSFIKNLSSFQDILTSHQIINKGVIKTIKTVHELMEKHAESPVVFNRKNSVIICEDNYNMKEITPLLVGRQIAETTKLTKNLYKTFLEDNFTENIEINK